jgi:SAM-dependent methyltransferase
LETAAHLRSEGLVRVPIDLEAIQRLPPDATVLEFGAGDGDVLPVLWQAVPKGIVVVMDQCVEVIRSLRDEFRGPFRFTQGRRPRDAGQAFASLDYVRSKRVAPYLDDAELEQFFADVADLLKPGGSLFITACHESQTPVESFRTHSLAQVIGIAGKAFLKPDRVEVAFIRPGQSHEPAEVLEFSVADVTPEGLRKLDKEIAERRACHAGDLEVEMRFWFARGSAELSGQHKLAEE